MAALTSMGLILSPNGSIQTSFDNVLSHGTHTPDTLHSDFSSSLFSLTGYVVFWDSIFSLTFSTFVSIISWKEYQWDRFGCLIKSRSVKHSSPASFYFLLSFSSFFKQSLDPGFPLPVFPLSHSFLPLPVLYSPVHPSIRYLLSRVGLLHNLAQSFSFHIIPQTHSICAPPFFSCSSLYTEWGGGYFISRRNLLFFTNFLG